MDFGLLTECNKLQDKGALLPFDSYEDDSGNEVITAGFHVRRWGTEASNAAYKQVLTSLRPNPSMTPTEKQDHEHKCLIEWLVVYGCASWFGFYDIDKSEAELECTEQNKAFYLEPRERWHTVSLKLVAFAQECNNFIAVHNDSVVALVKK